MSNETPSEFQIAQSGFVWGYTLDGAGNIEVVNASNLKVVLQTIPEASNRNFLWLHFNLSQASTERWLSENTALPPEFFEALHIGSRST